MGTLDRHSSPSLAQAVASLAQGRRTVDPLVDLEEIGMEVIVRTEHVTSSYAWLRFYQSEQT